jgi:hypothetical protein
MTRPSPAPSRVADVALHFLATATAQQPAAPATCAAWPALASPQEQARVARAVLGVGGGEAGGAQLGGCHSVKCTDAAGGGGAMSLSWPLYIR